jgi:hypothetical protein
VAQHAGEVLAEDLARIAGGDFVADAARRELALEGFPEPVRDRKRLLGEAERPD